MDPFAKFEQSQTALRWGISGLSPLPEEEWQRILTFVDLRDDERKAMLATIETLFRRGHELVVGTYDYLIHHEETAAILGWERGADPAHLAERRRFFTLWLARLLGMDLSDDLARYLFQAGKLHAGHGARRTHVPPVFVTGSISLVHAAFARFLTEEMPTDPRVSLALAGWNKVLTAHLHLMQMGFNSTVALDQGDYPVRLTLFGKMRTLAGLHELDIHLTHGAQMHDALCKFFNYAPNTRVEVFDVEWQSGEVVDHTGTPWFRALKRYRVKPTWRVLLNGKDVSFLEGEATAIRAGDAIHLFPTGTLTRFIVVEDCLCKYACMPPCGLLSGGRPSM